MKLILIGYMGSGKSIIGQNISQITGMDYIDLDEYIQLKENKQISEIFKERGEIYFRKLEATSLLEVLNGPKNVIVSLGGGTPCYGSNMKFISESEDTKSVYLKTSIQQLATRLKFEKSKRPMISHLTSDEALQEFIGKHLFERSFYYNQSNFTISTDQKTVTEISEEIILKLF